MSNTQSTWRLILLLCLAALTRAATANAAPSTFDVLAQMPECAQPCVLEATMHSTCLPTNMTCVCVNEDLQAAATICIKEKCSVKESLTTMNITATSCGYPVRDGRKSYLILNDIFGVLIGVSVLQRIAAKLYWKLGMESDDWCVLFTTIFLVIPSLCVNEYALVGNGMGLDAWTLPFDKITRFSTSFQIMAVLYFTQISLIKLTLLLFYLRVFPVRQVRYMVIGTMIFNCLYGLIYAIVTIFQCLPVGYLSVKWDGEHKGRCLNINAVTWSNAAISITVDLWMLVIPLLQIRTLQLDKRKKIGAIMMFCVGFAFTVISCIRLRWLVHFSYMENPTWTHTQIAAWSTSEIAVGIVCVCMPSYRLLLLRLFPKTFGTRHQFTPNDTSNSHSYAKSGKVDDSFASSRKLASTYTSDVSQSLPSPPPKRASVAVLDLEEGWSREDETTLVHMRQIEKGVSWAKEGRSRDSL